MEADGEIELLFEGPEDATDVIVLAHGAGAPMDSPYMNRMSRGLAESGMRVVRFQFPYMARRRGGGRRVPDREPVLRRAWLDVIRRLGGGGQVVIGGKSMGGRIASLVAGEAGARGLLCLGYPFHPPGEPSRLRTRHLESLAVPTLIVQGTRDPFGSPEDVAGYRLSSSIRVHWIEGGDHSFKPKARSGRLEEENLQEAIAAAVEFVRNLPPPARRT
jgi:uncharacterized protein